jgi:hypothetical protein
MSKELPRLKLMMISEADALEEIFKSVGDDDQKVEIPNLEVVVFVNLPSLCHVHVIQFQTVERFVQNCKKLSLTSLRRVNEIKNYLLYLLRQRDGIGTHYTTLNTFH